MEWSIEEHLIAAESDLLDAKNPRSRLGTSLTNETRTLFLKISEMHLQMAYAMEHFNLDTAALDMDAKE